MRIHSTKLIRVTFFFFLIFSLVLTYGQNGDFILSHHAPKHSEIDNINFEIKADKNGIICIANRFGVLKYDGLEWNFYRTQSSALSLAISPDNVVYVGCLGGFGKLDIVNNTYQYIPLLSADSTSDHFLQTFSVGDLMYFLSDHHIYAYTPKEDKLAKLESGDYLNGYLNGGALYINTLEEEVLKVTETKVEKVERGDKLWGIISPSPNGKNEFAVDLNGELFVKDEDEFRPHNYNKRLQEADVAITDLEWVNDTLVACSTIESGVFFLHVSDSSYFEITDYHSGLPDNEIHDLYADNNHGVWVAHEFGLTRIAPLFPAYSYTNFPGLEGNLIEAQRIKNDLWINTSLGVYYFSQDTSYRSRVYVQTVKKQQPKAVAKKSQQAIAKEPEEEIADSRDDSSNKKKGFLSGLFKKKDRANETTKTEEEKGFFKKIFTPGEETISKNENKTGDKYEYIRRVEKVVTGISYQFHHVSGTDGKFRQLLETQDRILVTSHTGIYEISKGSAELVINEPIRYAFVVPDSNKLIISTEQGLLKHYELVNDIWVEFSSQFFEDVILNVYMDQKQGVWLAGTSHIYEGSFTDNAFTILHSYEINNRFYDELSIWEHSDNLYFINSQGYFRLDKSNDRIIKDRELEEELGKPHHHLHNEKSRVWIYNGKIWHLLLPDGSINEFQYLGVFPNLKYINYDEKLDRYWLITDDNQLLAYAANQVPELNRSYALFIKRLMGKNGEIKVSDKFKLAHDQNTLSIELMKPDYVGFLNPEYQYKLEGLNQEWSAWTHANLIDYSFLPPGQYQLNVRVRDVLGQVEEATLLDFSVATPYWQQPWFYAVQALILALVIGITSRLDESKLINRIIKHGFSILTLIVIIEFMQAVISASLNIASTPVIDFLIDAGIAIMVFPLEWVLRKLILEGGLKISGKTQVTKL